jgi:hypothetical protein
MDNDRPRHPRWPRAAALVALAALGSGCADNPNKHSETDMLGLLALLPGRYDNSAQADLEAHNGTRPAHDAVALVITRVYTPRLGHNVYYAQETAADDPRRVFTQKMYGFEADEKRGILETLYEFVDPLRWRDGQQNPDLFTSIVIDDVQAEGCRLLWKKTADGYVGNNDPKACPASPASKVELRVGSLTIGDYKFRKVRR